MRKSMLWLILILSLTLAVSGGGTSHQVSTATRGPLAPAAFPPDPNTDITWSTGVSTVADIQEAFNAARQAENTQLGTSIPMMTLPSQAEWDALSEAQRALWLINRERIDREVLPLHGLEGNVSSVAQTYADFLMDNNLWGHHEDGRSPWQRLEANPAIGACHDFLNIAENLAYFVTTANNIPMSLERSVFAWLYNDGACCGWGHRHAILWSSYNNNSGLDTTEGFLGIGRASGPYRGWNYGELTVMNVFDPCSEWVYSTTYSIRGRVTVSGGGGLAGVTVSAGAGGQAVTDADGEYTIITLVPGAYTLTPALAGYSFVPAQRPVNITDTDLNGQDFAGTPDVDPTYRITGRVTVFNGGGLAGVTVSAGAAGTALTDEDGNFSISGMGPGSYTLTPALDGYTFSPATRDVAITDADVGGQDFAATLDAGPTYSASGRIMLNGEGMPGVMVSAGAGHWAVTGANGDYSITGLATGVYSLSPSRPGYQFAPPTRTVTITDGDATGLDFTAAEDGNVNWLFAPLVQR